MNFVVTECKPFNSIWVKCYIVNGEREKRGTGKYFYQKDFFFGRNLLKSRPEICSLDEKSKI